MSIQNNDIEKGHAVAQMDIDLREELENRIRFETLISDISARFVRLPSSEVDGQIERALKQVLDFFDVDRCGVVWVRQDTEFALLTHACYADGIEPVSKEINLAELFPWTYAQMLKGLPVSARQLAQLPLEAEQDRLHCLAAGIKSYLCIPLFCTQGMRYLLAIQSLRNERNWPDEFISRLNLLGEIFVNALERRNADLALRESEERLSMATDSAGVGLWIMDMHTHQVWVTPKLRELFNFTSDEEVNYESFFKVIHPEDHEVVRRAVEQALRTKEKLHVNYRVVLPDGGIRWIGVRGRPYCKSSGELDRLMGVSSDITDRKLAEEETLRMREEYTHIARVSVMGELTASLAHELKQPLAAIRSNAQAALRFLTGNKPDIDELHEVLKDIIIDNRRADEVIRRLRGMMRKDEIHITELNVKELVEDILPLVTSHEAMRKISLYLELDETIPLVAGDRIQIQQVVLNLILNSTEALMNMKKQARSITLRTHQQDSRTVTLSVKDNGPGIEAKAMPHLFEAFYTTKPEGLGMGLAICRSIVEKHGGRLWGENNPDGGATFNFTIPIARENSA